MTTTDIYYFVSVFTYPLQTHPKAAHDGSICLCRLNREVCSLIKQNRYKNREKHCQPLIICQCFAICGDLGNSETNKNHVNF